MLVRDKDITSEGNLGGLVVNMSLDEKGLSKIMSLLTNLYSDPAMATIRETCTNALDSHIAANQKRPIEISTPSRMYPYFVVQDFGIGMSTDDVINIVSKYGASTKTKSDDYNGMMGIGLKSPLAYTDQFTIIGIKDGKKSSILVTRTTDGASSMEIVDVSDTDEPNGVTVKVPVNKDFDYFSDKVEKFCDYADSTKFLLNHDVYDNKFEHLKNNIYIRPSGDRWSREKDRVVMGNVGYPMEAQGLMPNHQVIFYVPMGAVAFTPSREALEYTTQTKKTIDDIREEFSIAYSEWLSRETEKQPTFRDAFIKSLTLRQYHHVVKPLKWNGEDLPDRAPGYKSGYWNGDLNHHSGYCSFNSTYWSNRIGTLAGQDSNSVFIKNFDNIRFTRNQAKKIKKYFDDKNLTVPTRASLFSSNFDLRLFEDGLTVYDWEDIKKVKVTVIKKPTATTYEGYAPGNSSVTIYTPDKKKPLYYASKKEVQRTSSHEWISQEGDQFVYVTDLKKEKLLKDYPNAKHYREWFEDVVARYIATLTQADYDYFELEVRCNNLDFLESSDILDPDLRAIAEHNKGDSARITQRDRYEHYYRNISYPNRTNYNFPQPNKTGKGTKILNKYPLLQSNYYLNEGNFAPHLLEYVNYIYSKNKGV